MSMRESFESVYSAAQLAQHGELASDPFIRNPDGTYANLKVQSCWWGYQTGWVKALSVLAHEGLDVLVARTAVEAGLL